MESHREAGRCRAAAPVLEATHCEGERRRARGGVSDPTDLTLRQVCADALSEAGDVRGEFIALDLASQLTALQRKRHAALRKQCSAAFLGPIATFAFAKDLRFENGFPVAVCLGRQATRVDVSDEAQDAIVGVPEWSTIEAVDLFKWDRPTRALVEAESMRSLKRVFCADESLFALKKKLALEDIYFVSQSSHAEHAPFFKSTAVPRLKKLSFHPRERKADAAFRGLWRSPVMRQLEVLEVTTTSGNFTEWESLLTKVPSNVKNVNLRLFSPDHVWRFERVEGGWRGSLWVYAHDAREAERLAKSRALVRSLLPAVKLMAGEQRVERTPL